MDGKEVYKFAVKAMPHAAELALKRSELTKEDIDVLVPHQANIRIIQSAAKRLHVPMEKPSSTSRNMRIHPALPFLSPWMKPFTQA